MQRRTLLQLAAFVVMVPTTGMLLSACERTKAAPIKLGSILSVSGSAAFLGGPRLKKKKIYVERINAEGGVLGRQLVLVHYDDQSDAIKANGFAKRLIESDHVDLIVGGTTTGSTMAMVPLVEKAELPFISLAGAVVVIEPVKKWVFKTPHTDRMAAEKIYEDMKTRGLTKIGLLSETSGFGQSGRKEAQAAAAKFGITLAADETYGPKDTDVTAQLTKLKNTPGVQALLVFGLGQGPAVVTKNYSQLGMAGLPLYQSHGVASQQYIKLTGTASEGVRLPAAALLVTDKLPANDPQKSVVAAYEQAFKARYKDEVSTFGGFAYDGLMIAVNAIKRAGSLEKEKVRTAIESTHDYIGTSGVVNMSATDHLGLDLSAFRMIEVKNGDWSLVK